MIKTVRLGFAAAQNYGKKHFATAVKATKELKAKVITPGWVKSNIKALHGKAKHEVNITKLIGIKTYTKLKAKRIVSSKAFTKTKSAVKEYGPSVAIGGVLGVGIGSIASAGYNVATGYKTKRVKKKG